MKICQRFYTIKFNSFHPYFLSPFYPFIPYRHFLPISFSFESSEFCYSVQNYPSKFCYSVHFTYICTEYQQYINQLIFEAISSFACMHGWIALSGR